LDECQHDWRINPGAILPTLPPMQVLFCLKCEKERVAPFYHKKKISRRDDPSTWKKYLGELDDG